MMGSVSFLCLPFFSLPIAGLAPLALTGEIRLGVAILFGIALGFVLTKSGLAWRKECVKLSGLHSWSLFKVLSVVVIAGCVMFYFANGNLVQLQARPGYLMPSLLGGILCGIGFYLASMTPLTALVNLASGRLYALWVLLGMLLAFPAVAFSGSWLEKVLYYGQTPLGFYEVLPLSQWNNPFWFVIAGAGFILLISLLLDRSK